MCVRCDMLALVELVYATGMRVSELVGLPADRAQDAPAFLTVRGKGARERIVPLSDRAQGSDLGYLEARAAAGRATEFAISCFRRPPPRDISRARPLPAS